MLDICLIKVYLEPSQISVIVLFCKNSSILIECVQNRPLKSDWFFSQIPRKCNPGNLQNSERSDSIRYLLLKLTKLQHSFVSTNVNILQFSYFKSCCYGIMTNDFSYFTSFTLF